MKGSYRAIKDYVKRQITASVWPPGTKIPSENELMREFGVARMTVHRALTELTYDGLLGREQGRGTFVAELSPVSSFLRVRDIQDEIVTRGHRHHLARHVLRAERAPQAVAAQLDLAARARVFHVIVVHHENDVPVQVEERWINPAVAPDFLSIDLANETPGHYLTRVAPLTEAEHIIEAHMPGEAVRRLLALKRGEPCLRVRRRTWVRRNVAAYGLLSHPGSVYRLIGRYKP
jgi:GntR family transcriptional regulator, histidine utilization repressor